MKLLFGLGYGIEPLQITSIIYHETLRTFLLNLIIVESIILYKSIFECAHILRIKLEIMTNHSKNLEK